jgi:hypothetical protein
VAAVTLPAPVAEAVAAVRALARGCPEYWVVGGSAAAVLHGVPADPGDLDLETGAAGAVALSALLGGEIIRPVRFSSTGAVRSHYGQHRLGATVVDVIGDLEIRRPDGSWTSPIEIAAERAWVPFLGEPLPVLSLPALYRRYVDLDRPAKAAAVRARLVGSAGQGTSG